MPLTGDAEIDDWALQQRRRAGWRIVGVGAAVFVPALIWLVAYFNWDTDAPVTRIKVVGGVATAIGMLLVIAGFAMLWNARKRPLPEIPEAVARMRRDGGE